MKKREVLKGDYVLIKDRNDIQHVVRVDAVVKIDTIKPSKKVQAYASTIIKSIDKSNLNTTTFYDKDVQLILGAINARTLETEYPEIFL